MDKKKRLIKELSLLRKAAERIADALESIDVSLDAMVFEEESDSFLEDLLTGLEDEDYEDLDGNEFEQEEEEEEEGDEE